MDYFHILAISELFLLLLFAGFTSFLLLRIRKVLRKKNEQIVKLEQALRLRPPVPTPDIATNELELLRQQLKHSEKLLAYYSKRTSNLEQFRRLYFDLEMQVDSKLLSSLSQAGQNEQHPDAHDQLVDELQASLDEVAHRFRVETFHSSELKDLIDTLQRNAESLRQQLLHAKTQRKLAEQSLLDLNRYKQRAEILETKASSLQSELANYRSQHPASAVDSNAQAQLEKMQAELSGKDKEIRQLRNECETVALQYEELASQAPSVAIDTQLEAMKQLLDKQTAALERKQAEFEMLENYCLELEESSNEVTAITTPVVANNAPTQSVPGSFDAEVLLREKSEALSALTDNYQALQEQFIEIAEEDRLLREEVKQLKAANINLVAAMEGLRKSGDASTPI